MTEDYERALSARDENALAIVVLDVLNQSDGVDVVVFPGGDGLAPARVNISTRTSTVLESMAVHRTVEDAAAWVANRLVKNAKSHDIWARSGS